MADKSKILKYGEVASRLDANTDFHVFLEFVQSIQNEQKNKMLDGLCQDMTDYMSASKACRELGRVLDFCGRYTALAHKLKGETNAR